MIPIPAGVEIREAPDGLFFEHRWFTAKTVLLLVVAIFWNGFLLSWYGIAVSQGDLFMVLFPLLHVALGIGIAYSAIAGLFNRTTVTVSRGQLTVRHGPLPWVGNRTLDVATLRQLHCEQHVHRRKNSTTTTFSVEATFQDGTSVRLLSNLENLGIARVFEKKIEAIRVLVSDLEGDAR
jgi:hypothetical protein